jgi:hypothetical protein
MAKKFNITGLCLPDRHYMADVSRKMQGTMSMIDTGEYFIINRPRQYGKTTTLYNLVDALEKTGDYIVFNTSFEGVGDLMFTNEATFAPRFLALLADYAKYKIQDLTDWLRAESKKVNDLQDLSNAITNLVLKTDKRVVLLIDEVDKSSNNQLFVSFLGMLRNKYLSRTVAKTFHAVVLAGVHDVKSLKLKLRPDEEAKFNSPWNIAAEFTVDMNLQPFEIKPMLDEYAADKGVVMNTESIAERLFYYTSGYPFLVSKLCKMLDEQVLPTKNVREWTEADLEQTVHDLTIETNTNFENLTKNLENNPSLYELTFNILFNNDYYSYSVHDPLIAFGIMHGILKNGRGVKLHNIIYEEIIYHYMASKAKSRYLISTYTGGNGFYLPNNVLDMERVLTKFQEFMKEQYSLKDQKFLERDGRLVFLAFIRPIINGHGYDFKEVQISEEKRLDVTITYYERKYIAELKIWRGDKAHKEGLTQLVGYLDRVNQDKGFLLIFDNNETKTWAKKWIRTRGKKILAVWI